MNISNEYFLNTKHGKPNLKEFCVQTDGPLPVTGRRGCPLIPRNGDLPESRGPYESLSQMDLIPEFLVRGTKFSILPPFLSVGATFFSVGGPTWTLHLGRLLALLGVLGLSTTCYLLFTIYYLLPTTYYLLLSTYYLLPPT